MKGLKMSFKKIFGCWWFKPAKTTVEVYEAEDGWRWHAFADENGQLVAESGEHFDNKANAIRAAKAFVRRMAGCVEVVVID